MGILTIDWRHGNENISTVIASRNTPTINRGANMQRGNISGIDPLVLSVERLLIDSGIKKNISGENNREIYSIGRCELLIAFTKRGGRYDINGMQANVDVLTKAIARTVIRSASETDQEELEDYLYRCIELPENISYVMENKLPYDFYEMEIKDSDEVAKKFNQGHEFHLVHTTYEDFDFTKHECRLDVKQVDDESFAVELFAGVWGEISLKHLLTFINTYWKGQRRGSWSNISPEELYYKLVGDRATESQIKVMVEFLKQNRKEDIVERRAMQLVEDLSNDYENIKVGTYNDKKCMYVRGKITDWMVVETGAKHGIQDVATYALIESSEDGLGGSDCHVKTTTKSKLIWTGPICIDNQQSGASVGDQFAARAFACMNDSLTIQMVSTMKGYIRELEVGQTKCRLDWDALP